MLPWTIPGIFGAKESRAKKKIEPIIKHPKCEISKNYLTWKTQNIKGVSIFRCHQEVPEMKINTKNYKDFVTRFVMELPTESFH
jgi:hypothetical protein